MSAALTGAWELTRALSPRESVRLAERLSDGEVINSYRHEVELDHECPDRPWAMYLADDDGYRFLCFDLDASKGEPAYDAGKLGGWLDELNIAYLQTRSGPSGGRHVWVGLSEPIDPQTVRELAQLATYELPTLDTAPLSNARTGCVRPPGAPHRAGGNSTILSGNISALTDPEVTSDDIGRLWAYIVDAVGDVSPREAAHQPKGIRSDRSGHLYLEGRKRGLSARTRDLLTTPQPNTNASDLLITVLNGCAAARWRYEDVEPLAALHPAAFAHARSRATGRDRSQRTRRPKAESNALLERQWRRAVRWVASHPHAFTGVDHTYDRRAWQIAELIHGIQARADASPGRWGKQPQSHKASGGRYSHRLVLDGLCVLALTAVTGAVDADIRRLALNTGLGREAVRTALLSLQSDGWISKAAASSGTAAARWRLHPRFSTELEAKEWSQATPSRPEGAGVAARAGLLHQLQQRQDIQTHDVYSAPRSLGRKAGLLASRLRSDVPQTVASLSLATGFSPDSVKVLLRSLRLFRLCASKRSGWVASRTDRRAQAASRLAVTGYLASRHRRYENERQLFRWWLDEYEWMTTHSKRRTRQSPSQPPIWLQQGESSRPFPRHPRDETGRADFRRARLLYQAGALDAPAFSSSAFSIAEAA